MNVWAILACGVFAQVLGAFWYSPIGLGKPWMKEMGWGKLSEKQIKEKQKAAMPGYIGSFIGALLAATILSHLFDAIQVNDWVYGLRIGVGVWLGFVATSAAMPSLWEGRSWKLYKIGAAYYLVQLAVFGAILGAW